MEILWQFLIENGISSADLENLQYLALLLLMLPIVATLIGISRYIIGLRSLNFYVPLLLTFIFFEISYADKDNPNFWRGLFYGITAFIVVFLISTITYSVLKRLRMHYIPKLSLIITATSVAIMFLVLISIYLERSIFTFVGPLVFITLATTTEGFMSVYAKKNFKYTLSIAFETLLISIFSFIILSSLTLQNLVLTYPLVLIGVLIIINIYVGRFLGLRLTEYWRFRNILIQEDTSSNEQTSSNTSK